MPKNSFSCFRGIQNTLNFSAKTSCLLIYCRHTNPFSWVVTIGKLNVSQLLIALHSFSCHKHWVVTGKFSKDSFSKYHFPIFTGLWVWMKYPTIALLSVHQILLHLQEAHTLWGLHLVNRSSNYNYVIWQ